MNNNKTSRINIEEKASILLQEMLREVKDGQEFIKVNQSKLASSIISIFFNKYFKKEKNKLTKQFFDERAFIQDAVKNSKTNEELEEKLSQIIKKKRVKRKAKKTLETFE